MPQPEKIILTLEDCEKTINYPFGDLIKLTGIYGYTTASLEELDTEVCYYQYTPECIEVAVKFDSVTLEREINLKTKTIFNHSFKNYKKQQIGIGTQIFLSQINHARLQGFKMIEVIAQKGQPNGSIDYVGHLVWAKLGYSMHDTSKEKFRMHLRGTPFENIGNVFDLVCGSDQGALFWLKDGCTWNGFYDLNPNSENEYMTYSYASKKRQEEALGKCKFQKFN